MSFAPVIVVTLNRSGHFKKCIESLKANTLASETILYVGVDYPTKDEHNAGRDEILAYLNDLKGFKSVEIVIRERNFGAVNNAFSLFDQVTSAHDRFIFSEDDNVFSPNFLKYINNGLDLYKNDRAVSAICGYNYPVDESLLHDKLKGDNVFLTRFFTAWGYGTWRDRYLAHKEKRSLQYCRSLLRSPKILLKLYRVSRTLLIDLFLILKNEKVTDDTTICFNNIDNSTFCILPAISKVRNIGNDGTGQNCIDLGKKSVFMTQSIDVDVDFVFSKNYVGENREIAKIIKKYFDRGSYTFFKVIVMFIVTSTWRLIRSKQSTN